MWILAAAVATGAVLCLWATPRAHQAPKTKWSRFVSGLAILGGLAWLAFYIADFGVGLIAAAIASFLCIWFMIGNTAVGVLREPRHGRELVMTEAGTDQGGIGDDQERQQRAVVIAVLCVSSVLAAVAAVVAFTRGEGAVGGLTLCWSVGSIAGLREAGRHYSRV